MLKSYYLGWIDNKIGDKKMCDPFPIVRLHWVV